MRFGICATDAGAGAGDVRVGLLPVLDDLISIRGHHYCAAAAITDVRIAAPGSWFPVLIHKLEYFLKPAPRHADPRPCMWASDPCCRWRLLSACSL